MSAEHAQDRQQLARERVAKALRSSEADALRLLEEAVALDPFHAEAAHALGRLLLGRQDFAAAVTYLARAAEMQPANADAHADLGAALTASGQFDAALRAFEAATALSADHEVAREGLALVRGLLARRQPSQPARRPTLSSITRDTMASDEKGAATAAAPARSPQPEQKPKPAAASPAPIIPDAAAAIRPLAPEQRVFAGGWAKHCDAHCIWIAAPEDETRHHAVEEIAAALSGAFAELGGSAPVVRDASQWNGRAPIVLGARPLSAAVAASLPADAIIAKLEPLRAGRPQPEDGDLPLLRRFPVLVFSARDRQALVAAGVPRVEQLELGYLPGLTRIALQTEARRDIDVLVLGPLNERRQKILAGLAGRRLKAQQLSGANGAARDAAIARAKIVLHVQDEEAQGAEPAAFDLASIAYLLANGVAVVSEGAPADPEAAPFAGGVAVLPYPALVEACATLARDAFHREHMARIGFEKFTSRPQAELLRRLLRPDDAPADGEASPTPAPTAPGHPLAGGWEAHRDRHCIWIAVPPGLVETHIFDEVAQTLSAAFTALGGSAPVVRQQAEWNGRAPIVLGAHLLADVALPLPRDSIVVNFEQIIRGSRWLNETHLSFLRRFPLLDASAHNQPMLERLGIRHRIPFALGYDPALTRVTRRPEAEKDIDVLFYGWPSARRVRLVEDLRRRGLKAVQLFNVFAEARDAAIARAKIVLNVHFYTKGLFEIVRASYLMANRACVVSEGRPDDPDLVPFAGGIELADYDHLAERCARLVADAERREAVAQRGFELFSARPQASLLRELADAGAAQR